MLERFSNWLIARAKRTPYFHLAGYMNRWWLVPYSYVPDGVSATDPTKTEMFTGCGPVSFWRRPIAWVLQRFDIAVRVHEILRSDDARAFHDHPWPYITVVLRGGYTEVTPRYDRSGFYLGARYVWRGAGSILFRRAKSWHRLVLDELNGPKPATTLFITFKKRQAWGFMPTPETKVYWRDYT